jgi:hypothetical protein
MVNGKEKNVHVRRLIFYENKYLLGRNDIRNHAIHSSKGFEIDKIVSSRGNAKTNDVEFEVLWFGMPKSEATWLSYAELEKINPDKLDRYLMTAEPNELIQRLLKQRNLI